MKQIKVSILLILFSYTIETHSQEIKLSTMSSIGGSTTFIIEGKKYHALYSIGQESVIGHFFNNLSVRQGFIQPPINGKFNEINNSSLSFLVFPNPFSDNLDILGRIVHSEIKTSLNDIKLNLSHLQSASYSLKLTTENYQYNFKILKK